MKIVISHADDKAPIEYTFSDDTSFEKDIPFHGWFRVVSEGKTWWFNAGFVIGIFPS